MSPLPSESPINDWADYWRYKVGVNVIPADTKNKKTWIQWSPYQNNPVSEIQHEQWKKEKSFLNGIAIIPGKIWHNEFKKGLYLVFVDLDNRKAIEEFCSRNGNNHSLEELSKHIIIEQHRDEPNKAHAYFYSKHPFPKKSSDRISDLSGKIDKNEVPAIEVKGLGEHGIAYCTPSPHKNGHNYEIIGTTEACEINDLDVHIDSICKKYNIPYLDGNGNGNTGLTPIQDYFKEDVKVYEGHNRHEALLRVMESLLSRNHAILTDAEIKPLAANWNKQHCIPPLNEREFNNQWTDATNFIKKKTNEENPSTDGTEAEAELIKIPVTDKDINSILEMMYKEAEHDKPSIKQLFYGMSSAFTKCGISHNVNSPVAGAGKNYLLRLVSSFFPRKYVEQFAGVSDKAFFHRRGKMVIKNEQTGDLEFVEPLIEALEKERSEIETVIELEKEKDPGQRDKKLLKEKRSRIKDIDNQICDIKKNWQKLIVIGDLIIILLDTPQEGFFATLMSLVSADTGEDQEYLFTDKTASGRNEATSNIIRGQPTIFTAQVVDDTENKRFAEKNRRFVPITPNISKDKINAATRIMGKKAGLLSEEYSELVASEADKEKARQIVSSVVEKLKDHSRGFKLGEYGISIPFHEALSDSITADQDGDVWRMTVMKRLLDYLAIITKVRMNSCPRIVDTTTGAFYPIATFAHLAEALEIMERGGTNVKAYLVDFYNKVFLPAFKALDGKPRENNEEGVLIEKEQHVGLTTEEIGEKMASNPGIRQLRNTYLYPLANSGLLNSVRSKINKTENIWFPVDENVKSFSLFNGEDRRLVIKNLCLYPDSNFIEKTYSSIVKRETETDHVQKKNSYRLEDGGQEGIEISVKEMIEKYFLNPESWFKNEDKGE